MGKGGVGGVMGDLHDLRGFKSAAPGPEDADWKNCWRVSWRPTKNRNSNYLSSSIPLSPTPTWQPSKASTIWKRSTSAAPAPQTPACRNCKKHYQTSRFIADAMAAPPGVLGTSRGLAAEGFPPPPFARDI